MKQASRRCLYLLLGICLYAGACKDHKEDKKDEAADVLRQPPYAALTDSLDQLKATDPAGLHFRRGELLSHNNLHELAVADYRAAWNLHPDEATGLRYATTLSIVGQTDSAIRLLQECRRQYPANASFSNMLGDLYLQSGRMKDALQLYDDLLQADPGNFEAWYEKGLLLEKAADTAGALEALHKAYTLQPVNTYTLELAHLYAESRNSAALSLCDEVLRKDSGRSLLDPFFIKGIYYSNTAQYARALVQFDSCIGRDWKFTDAYLEKGIVLFHQKKYPQAMEVFQMSIKVSNTYADGYYWMGRCYEATGQKEEAITWYQQALGLDKDFTEAAERIRRLRQS